MRTLVWLNGVVFVALAACAAAVGCGEPFQLTGSGGTGGTGGTGGMTSTSSTGGMGGTGGGGDMTGGGGTGGMKPCVPGTLSTCGAGEYCRTDTMKCESCADIGARFVFGQATLLGVPLPSQTTGASFPRVGKDGALYFSYTTAQSAGDIAMAMPDPMAPLNPLKWSTANTVPPPVSQPSTKESAPLYLDKGTAIDTIFDTGIVPSKPLLIFDVETTSPPKAWASNNLMASALKLSGMSNANAYQIAVALDAATPRVWFVTAGTPSPTLYTVTPNDPMDNMPKTAKLLVEVGNNTCLAKGDYAPWVTPNGDFMLFQSSEQTDACGPASARHHLYYTPLYPDGQQQDSQNPMDMKAAKEIFPGNTEDYQTPSLSPDLCVLYFAHNDPMNGMTLMGAIRE